MHPHRSCALDGAAAALTVLSGTHAWCGHATVMVLASSAAGPRVSGCTRAPHTFGRTSTPCRLTSPSADLPESRETRRSRASRKLDIASLRFIAQAQNYRHVSGLNASK